MTFQQGVLGDGELTNTAKWYYRILKVINDLLQTLRGDTAWQPATLAGTWTAAASGFAVPGYRIRDGILYLCGAVTGGSDGQLIFTLPVGYRPSAGTAILGAYASSTFVRIDVATSGTVTLVETGTGGSPTNVYLSDLCVPLS